MRAVAVIEPGKVPAQQLGVIGIHGQVGPQPVREPAHGGDVGRVADVRREKRCMVTEAQHPHARAVHRANHVRCIRAREVDGIPRTHVAVHVIDRARWAVSLFPELLRQR